MRVEIYNPTPRSYSPAARVKDGAPVFVALEDPRSPEGGAYLDLVFTDPAALDTLIGLLGEARTLFDPAEVHTPAWLRLAGMVDQAERLEQLAPLNEVSTPKILPVLNEPLQSTADVATRLGVSKQTVHRWVKDGTLRAIRLPGGHLRFRPSDIEAIVSDAEGVAS